MKQIDDWQNKDLECHWCETKKGVKYTVNGKPHCHKCMMERFKRFAHGLTIRR